MNGHTQPWRECRDVYEERGRPSNGCTNERASTRYARTWSSEVGEGDELHCVCCRAAIIRACEACEGGPKAREVSG